MVIGALVVCVWKKKNERGIFSLPLQGMQRSHDAKAPLVGWASFLLRASVGRPQFSKVLLLRLIECSVVRPTGLPAVGLHTSIPHTSSSTAGPVDSSSGSSVGLLLLKFWERSWNCVCATVLKVFLLFRKCPKSDSVRRDVKSYVPENSR